MEPRVRFAPSPTGYLHVGGLRTALYNFLFARNNNGKMILRIEDTDRSRYVENAMEMLIESLSWAGIEFDEGPGMGGEFGPYTQSERLELYGLYADTLIKNGSAYYAFDTPEEIEAMRSRQQEAKETPRYDRSKMRNNLTLGKDELEDLFESGEPYIIRLHVPENRDVIFNDLIRGEVKVNSKEIDDQVLMKSDGYPTYHLANVIDDHLMKITHVIRGEEWLPSTPKHVLLYEAFGWDIPDFAHLPLLLNDKKQKLSKRHGDVAVEEFRAKGYEKEAFVNFIALLGWNPTGDREIYSYDELISMFNIRKVNKGGAIFDNKKLDWMNARYLKLIPDEKLTERLKKMIEGKYGSGFTDEFILKLLNLFRERVHFLHEIPEIASYMFKDPLEFDEKYMQKHWNDDTPALMLPLIERFEKLEEFTNDSTHDATMDYVEEKGIKLRDVIHPIRLMITGASSGAGMFETMEVLGKDACTRRMRKFIELKITENRD